MPPDGRIFVVKDAMSNPTDTKSIVLWIKACRTVTKMTSAKWTQYPTYSRDEIMKEADPRIGNDGSWLILEIFKRYLVWRELVEDKSRRAREIADTQPSAAQLQAFLDESAVEEKRATLVDMCHNFPHARDPQTLMYRIERFATLTSQPSSKTIHDADRLMKKRYSKAGSDRASLESNHLLIPSKCW